MVNLWLWTIHFIYLNVNTYDTKDIRPCKTSHHFKQKHSHAAVCKYIWHKQKESDALIVKIYDTWFESSCHERNKHPPSLLSSSALGVTLSITFLNSTLSRNACRHHDHRPCKTSHQSIYRSTHMCQYANIQHANRKSKIRLLLDIYDLWCVNTYHERKNIRRAPEAWVIETFPYAFLLSLMNFGKTRHHRPQQQMIIISTNYSHQAEEGNRFIHSSR